MKRKIRRARGKATAESRVQETAAQGVSRGRHVAREVLTGQKYLGQAYPDPGGATGQVSKAPSPEGTGDD